MALVRLVKAFKHQAAALFVHPDAVVAHEEADAGHDAVRLAELRPQDDLPALGRIFPGVVQENRQDLRQPVFVGDDGGKLLLGHLQRQGLALFGKAFLVQVKELPHDLRGLDLFHLKRGGVGLKAAQLQQVVDQAGQAADLVHDDAVIAHPLLFVRHQAVPKALRQAAHIGQRGP